MKKSRYFLCKVRLALFAVLGLLTLSLHVQAEEVSLTNNNGIYLLQSQATTIQSVFDYVEQHSKYVFVYGSSVKHRLTDKVSINLKGSNMLSLIKELCNQTGLEYRVKGRQISILASTTNLPQQNTQQKAVNGRMKRISGNIVDSKGEPLIGATIKVKGTTIATVTDIDGNYSLEVPDEATLQVSYVGFNNSIIKVGNKSSYNIEMSEDNNTLNELIVIGYGVQKKSDLTGGVASIDQKKLNLVNSGNLVDRLIGQVPGLSITTTNQTPGAEQQIRVRGENSLSADNSPLIVLDGMPYNGSLGDIDPNIIDNVSVLKDASAAAIYGSRGSNGVILIQSKKGVKGKPMVSYKGKVSWAEPQQRIDVCTPEEYMQLKRDIARLKYGWTEDKMTPENLLSASELQNYQQDITNDWQDYIFRTAFTMEHQLSLSGGTDNTKYYGAVSYLDENGVVYNSGYKTQVQDRTAIFGVRYGP